MKAAGRHYLLARHNLPLERIAFGVRSLSL